MDFTNFQHLEYLKCLSHFGLTTVFKELLSAARSHTVILHRHGRTRGISILFEFRPVLASISVPCAKLLLEKFPSIYIHMLLSFYIYIGPIVLVFLSYRLILSGTSTCEVPVRGLVIPDGKGNNQMTCLCMLTLFGM